MAFLPPIVFTDGEKVLRGGAEFKLGKQEASLLITQVVPGL